MQWLNSGSQTPAIDYIVSLSMHYELHMFIKACKY